MQLNELKPTVKNKKVKRVGRGPGSGHGKTSTKGHKGAKARSGRLWFIGMEGGNVPMFRKLPKYGFKHFNTDYQEVNLKDLESTFDADSVIDAEALVAKKLIKNAKKPLKILGAGKITKKFTVKANKFSKKAVESISSLGGKTEVIELVAKEAKSK